MTVYHSREKGTCLYVLNLIIKKNNLKFHPGRFCCGFSCFNWEWKFEGKWSTTQAEEVSVSGLNFLKNKHILSPGGCSSITAASAVMAFWSHEGKLMSNSSILTCLVTVVNLFLLICFHWYCFFSPLPITESNLLFLLQNTICNYLQESNCWCLSRFSQIVVIPPDGLRCFVCVFALTM